MKTEPNDQAYPVVAPGFSPEGGLTKRELFAAMAMQGLLANGREFKLKQTVDIADGLIWALNNHKKD